jgi:hypothetical protein
MNIASGEAYVKERANVFARTTKQGYHQATRRRLETQKLRWELSSAQANTVEEQFHLYWWKWDQLMNRQEDLFPLEFNHIPWPVLHFKGGSDITTEHVERFVFWPSACDMPIMQRKQKAKKALQLWHLDKFQSTVLERVMLSQRPAVEQKANLICAILTGHLACT